MHRPYVSYTYYIYEQVVVHQCVVVSASQHDVRLILRPWKRHYILISLLALCDNLLGKNSINRSHNQFASEANDISKKCAFAAKNCVLHIFCQLQSLKSFFNAIYFFASYTVSLKIFELKKCPISQINPWESLFWPSKL